MTEAEKLLRNITEQLCDLGVRERQLVDVRFIRPDPSRSFDCWPFTFPNDMSETAIPLLKDFLTFRWIVRDAVDMPTSDAWRSANEYASLKNVATARAFTQNQSEKAKRPRGRTDDGRSSEDLVATLCSKPESRETSAAELWPHFFSFLESEMLDPEGRGQTSYIYETKSGRKRIARRTFANLVSRVSRSKKTKDSW